MTQVHTNKENIVLGTHINATILDFDPRKNVADLSLKPSLLDRDHSEKFGKKLQKHVNKELEAVVELVKPSYCIASLIKYPSVIGKVVSVLPNDAEYPITKLSYGSKVRVILQNANPSGTVEFVLLPKKDTKRNHRENSGIAIHETVSDENIKDISDYKIGTLVKGIIKSIKNCQANVLLSRKQGDVSALIEGRIHVSELFDEMPICKDVFEEARLKSGMTISAKVIGFSHSRTHKWLPLSHAVDAKTVVELSVRPSILNSQSQAQTLNDIPLSNGMIVTGVIQDVIRDSTKYALKIYLNRKHVGRVQIIDVSNDVESITTYRKTFSVGQSVRCAIIGHNDSDGTAFELTLRIFDDGEPRVLSDIKSLKIGDKVSSRITGLSSKGINAIVSSSIKDKSVFGFVPMTEIAQDFDNVVLSNFEKDHFLTATIFAIDEEQSRVQLTLRHDGGKCIRGIRDVVEGSLIRGFISNISPNGVFINIGFDVSARVKIGELSDDFIKDWSKKFKIGQVVTCKIQNVDIDGGKVEATMKTSETDPAAYSKLQGSTPKLKFEDLEVGQVMTGTIVQVQEKAVLVDLDNTQSFKKAFSIRGRCHVSEMSDTGITDVASLFENGDRVKCMVLLVDHEKKHVNLGLKPSYFSQIEMSDIASDGDQSESESGDDDVDEVESEFESLLPGKLVEFESTLPSDSFPSDAAVVTGSHCIDDSDSGSEEMEWDIGQPKGDSEDTEGQSDDDATKGESNAAGKSKLRRDKRRAKLTEEESIERKERMLAAGATETPETPEDFERLLFASPNSSFLWIQYMAFYVNILDLGKARNIATRALATINYREEKEKFNVWAAYLNLENKFGSPESLNHVFEKATSYNEPKHVYLCLADIYLKTEKFELLENLFTSMLKKFKTSFKVWMYAETYFFKRSRPEEARALLQRSLQAVPKRKHVKAVSRFAAQLEFIHGSVELGRTLMEGIISNNSKRLDIWTMFVDMEIKRGNTNAARKLLERAIHMKLSSRKMKSLFKKYLDLEKRFGNEETVQHVVKAATEYVESITEKE